MEIKEMQMEDIQRRMCAIETEIETDGADLEALNAEVDQPARTVKKNCGQKWPALM